jgi:hypothetical protein
MWGSSFFGREVERESSAGRKEEEMMLGGVVDPAKLGPAKTLIKNDCLLSLWD